MNKVYDDYLDKIKNSIISSIYAKGVITPAEVKIAISQDYAELLSLAKELENDDIISIDNTEIGYVYTLTKKGVFKYLYDNDQATIKKCFDLFNEYEINPYHVELFLFDEFYSLYINRKKIDFDTIIDEFSDYAISRGLLKHRLKK